VALGRAHAGSVFVHMKQFSVAVIRLGYVVAPVVQMAASVGCIHWLISTAQATPAAVVVVVER